MRAESQSAQDALQDLVNEELMVQHAEALGLGDERGSALESRRLAVHALLQTVVEGEVTEETLDPEVLEREARSVADHRVRPGDRWCEEFRIGRSEEGALAEAESVRERWARGEDEAFEMPESLRRGQFQSEVRYDPERSGNALVRAVYELGVAGDVTDTIRDGEDFVVCRLLRMEPDGEVHVDDVRAEVQGMYLNHERGQALLRLMQGVEENIRVVRDDEAIERTLNELRVEELASQ